MKTACCWGCGRSLVVRKSECGAGDEGDPGFEEGNDCARGGGAGGSDRQRARVQAWASQKFQSDKVAKAFTKWFGDSKAVDSSGRPLVLYHGTPDGRWLDESDPVFQSPRERFLGAKDDAEAVHWFAADHATAHSYADDRRAFDYQGAEPKVMQAYLQLSNPYEIDANGKEWRDAQKRGKTGDVIEAAKKAGHDGIIIRNVKDHYENTGKTKTTDTYAVFSAKQVKSATDNDGSFDADDPSIKKSSGCGAGEEGDPGFQEENDCAHGDGGGAGAGGGKAKGGKSKVTEWAKAKFGTKKASNGKTVAANFAAWFGDSRVVDADGDPQETAPVVVYYGTTHDFDEFSSENANIENDLGAGHYFTDDPGDAETNYGGEGPDLTQRIDIMSDTLESELESAMSLEGDEKIADIAAATDMDEDAVRAVLESVDDDSDKREVAREIARAKLVGGEPRVVSAYLKIENPVVLGTPVHGKGIRKSEPGETVFDVEYDERDENDRTPADDDFDPDTAEIHGEKGSLVTLLDNVRSIAANYEDHGGSADELDTHLAELKAEAVEYGGIAAGELVARLKNLDSLSMLADPDTQKLAAGDIVAKALRESGFDGVIYANARDHFPNFGLRGTGTPIADGTRHFIVWESEQIKSVDNEGTFDGSQANINKSLAKSSACGAGEETDPGFEEGNTCAAGDGAGGDSAGATAKEDPEQAKKPNQTPHDDAEAEGVVNAGEAAEGAQAGSVDATGGEGAGEAAGETEKGTVEHLRAMFEQFAPKAEEIWEELDGETVTIMSASAAPEEVPDNYVQAHLESETEYLTSEKFNLDSKYIDEDDKKAVMDKAAELAEETGNFLQKDAARVDRDFMEAYLYENTPLSKEDSRSVGEHLAKEMPYSGINESTIREAMAAKGIDPESYDELEPENDFDSHWENARDEAVHAYTDDAIDALVQELVQEYLGDGTESAQESWDQLDDKEKAHYVGSDETIGDSEVVVRLEGVGVEGKGHVDDDQFYQNHAAAQALIQRFADALIETEASGESLSGEEVQARALELWQGWIVSSSSRDAMALKAAAAEALGAVAGPYEDSVGRARSNTDRIAIKAAWLASQAMLKAQGVEKLVLYRGIKLPDDTDQTVTPDGQFENIDLEPRHLQSTTTDIEVARRFATHAGAIIRIEVPREFVVSVPAMGKNDHGEEEYLILGGYWPKYDVWKGSAAANTLATAPIAEATAEVTKSMQQQIRRTIVMPAESFAEERRNSRKAKAELKQQQRQPKAKKQPETETDTDDRHDG